MKDMGVSNIFCRKNRILLGELVKTDFKLRYQGSALGYMWAVLRPLLMFAILYLVFAKLLRFGGDIPHYPVYLLTGTVLWNFFTECTGQGIQSIVMRGDLIRKISFPKYIIVLAATSTALINLAINLGVIIIFALINGVMPSWSWLIVPFSVLELYLFALGISFLLSAINARYRDVTSIWEVLTQALFYAVPIIYPLSLVLSAGSFGHFAAQMILLNPIAQVIQDVRYNLITDTTLTSWGLLDGFMKLIPLLIVVILLIFSALFFQSRSKHFAEEI